MTKQTEIELTVTTTMKFSLKQIAGLLCSAFEGGSNYWYTITKYIKPKELKFRFDDEHIYRHLDYPLNEGGGLMIGDLEDETRKPILLNLEACKKGLQVMADKCPKHFADFLQENDDAITGDVFLQCCLFGEIVYG